MGGMCTQTLLVILTSSSASPFPHRHEPASRGSHALVSCPPISWNADIWPLESAPICFHFFLIHSFLSICNGVGFVAYTRMFWRMSTRQNHQVRLWKYPAMIKTILFPLESPVWNGMEWWSLVSGSQVLEWKTRLLLRWHSDATIHSRCLQCILEWQEEPASPREHT